MSRGHAIACAECRELLGGYVLEALEPDEMDAVRAHIAACPDCAREHAELAPLPALLEAAGSTEPATDRPPAALEDAVLDRFARERPRPARRAPRVRRWLTRPIPVAVAAATAAATLTLLVSAGLNGSSSSSAHTYGAWLRGTPAAPAARAYAKLSRQAAGTRVQLDVRGMRPAPGAVYELWCVDDNGGKVSAGTFRVDSSGTAHVRLTTAARLGEYHRLSVQAIAGPDTPRPLLAGSIEY